MKYKHIITAICAMLVIGCSEKQLEPISKSLGKPGVPTEVIATPTAGGVIITYRIPDMEDILGVKAVYKLSNGKERKVISSLYDNQVSILGYSDEQEHTVKLYALNRAMEESDPVEVKFTPMESPISKVAKTMKIDRDFGGALYTWSNEDRATMNIEVITTDSLGRMVIMKIQTTSAKEGKYALRGYDTKARWFAAVVRDRFENVSDSIFPSNPAGNRVQISPMYEQKLDKKKFKVMFLNNDASFANYGGSESDMIDDNLDSFGHTANGSLPAAVTLDLGAVVKLSRIVIHQRNNSFYGWGNPKVFEVYNASGVPSKDGDWGQWGKVLDCVVIKPSGSPIDVNTDEDLATAKAGHDFSFSLSQEPMRYVRIRFTQVWTSSTFCHPAEITFYGDPNI